MARLIDSGPPAPWDGNGEQAAPDADPTVRGRQDTRRRPAETSSTSSRGLQTFVTTFARTAMSRSCNSRIDLPRSPAFWTASRSDLDAALKNLSIAVADVHRFRREVSRQDPQSRFSAFADVTQNLVDHRTDLENRSCTFAPNSFANAYKTCTTRTTGEFTRIDGAQRLLEPGSSSSALRSARSRTPTAPETAKLCADYMGPAAAATQLQLHAHPVQPVSLQSRRSPDNLVYTDPRPGAGCRTTDPVAADVARTCCFRSKRPEPQTPPKGNPPS